MCQHGCRCVLLLLGVTIAVFRFRQHNFGAKAIQTKGETWRLQARYPCRYMNAQIGLKDVEDELDLPYMLATYTVIDLVLPPRLQIKIM